MKPATNIRLDMASIHASSFRSCDVDPSSPDPPSSPSADSSDDEDLPHTFTTKASLRSSIAELPETKLRSIIFKLVSSNPRFERAIRKELALARSSGDSPPLTPTSPKPRRTSRKSRRNCKEVEVATQEPQVQEPGTGSPLLPGFQEEFMYHPGYLDREVYEFLPLAPQCDVVFADMRTVTMWSCCDEDECSPGCMILSPYMYASSQDQYGPNWRDPSHPDVFPDSDLERR